MSKAKKRGECEEAWVAFVRGRKGGRMWARWRRKGENWVWREFEKSVELIGVVAGEFEVGVDEWRGMFVQGKMLGVDKVRS